MNDDLNQQERDLWGEAPEESFEEWLAYGVEHGFCSPQVCATHAGINFCVHVVRLGNEEDWQADIASFNEDSMEG